MWQIHGFIVVVRWWWRGYWVARLGMFPAVWFMLVFLHLKDEPPHATGLHRIWIISILICSLPAAWIILGLPVYLRAWKARPAPRYLALGSAGSRGLLARASEAPGLLRLSRRN